MITSLPLWVACRIRRPNWCLTSVIVPRAAADFGSSRKRAASRALVNTRRAMKNPKKTAPRTPAPEAARSSPPKIDAVHSPGASSATSRPASALTSAIATVWRERSPGCSIALGSGDTRRRHQWRLRSAARTTDAARAAPRCGASSCSQALNHTTSRGSSPPRLPTRCSSIVCSMQPSELLPPPQGALTAMVSGVAVSSSSTIRASAFANSAKPKRSSAGSPSGASASSATRRSGGGVDLRCDGCGGRHDRSRLGRLSTARPLMSSSLVSLVASPVREELLRLHPGEVGLQRARQPAGLRRRGVPEQHDLAGVDLHDLDVVELARRERSSAGPRPPRRTISS